jgi:hypothetical protein
MASPIQAALLLFSLIQLSVVSANLRSCVTSFNATEDYFPDKIQIKEAKQFSVQYFNNYKMVTVTAPIPSNLSNQVTYCLVQCGTPAPPDLPANVPVVIVPINRIIALSSTHIGFIRVLADTSSLVAVSSRQDVGSTDILNRIELGIVGEVSPRSSGLNLTLVNSYRPDVVLDFVYGDYGFQQYLQMRSQVVPLF